ncbi:MAG: hypothetical protein HC853_16860, partial [Anaerolineae bacterium]|nr:hypothetical protein [Anaerolineae bacterium]
MSNNLQLLGWVLITLLIGLAALQIAYKSGAGQLARLTQTTASGHLLGELAAFAFHVGIPFVALIFGALGLDHMALGQVQPNTLLGFTPFEWLRGTGITLATALFVLGVIWLMARFPSPVLTGEGLGVRGSMWAA